MQVNRKVTILLSLCAGVVTTGCAGIQAAPSFSPLSLFLPGLVQKDRQTDAPVPAAVQTPDAPVPTEEPVVVAQVR